MKDVQMMTATPRTGSRQRVQGAPLPEKNPRPPLYSSQCHPRCRNQNLCGHACHYEGEKKHFKQY